MIDFLKEDISTYSDSQIGAAARKIHAECAKTLEELVTVRPLFSETEGSSVVIPQGYHVQEVKVSGNVRGAPPYKGTLRHKGWCAHKHTLPKESIDLEAKVIAPAEVEV